MESFFAEARSLGALFLLLDSRREPSEEDVMMLELARSAGVPVKLVLTKTDKLSGNELAKAKTTVASAMEVDPAAAIAFSSVTRRGVDAVWKVIDSNMNVQAAS